jgi:uncharacterized delta-60 repeat protein
MQLRGFAPTTARNMGMGFAIGCGVLLVGCPQATNCDDPANAAACGNDQTVGIEASSSVVRVVQGDQASLEITLEWPETYNQPVTFEADDTPSGISVEPVTVQAQEQTAMLNFRASAETEQGVYPIRIVPASGSGTTPVEIEVELVVAGLPGSADTSFDYDGQVGYGSLDEVYLEPRVSVMDAQGRLVIIGERRRRVGEDLVEAPPYMIRLNADASVDTAFIDKLAQQTTDSQVFLYSDVFLDAEQNIISMGWFKPETDVVHGLIERRDTAGTLDPSFGDNGRILVAVDDSLKFGRTNLLVRKDDFVVLYENSAYAYLPSGERNPAFGDEGHIGNLPGYWGPDAVLLPDDNILWMAQKTVDYGALITNENATALDTDISRFRSILSQFYGYCPYFRTTFCWFDAEDRIVCPGGYSNDPDPDSNADVKTGHAFLVRMNHQGDFDPTFGEGGLIVRRGTATSNTGLAILQNGQILVSEYDESPVKDAFLALYNSNGSIDRGFGSNGRIPVPVHTVVLHVDEIYGRVTFAGMKDDRLIIARHWL